METRPQFWWLKTPEDHADTSSSLADFLDREQRLEGPADADIGSILDEIDRVAAQSPLGPFEKPSDERSVEEIMKEAERIFVESSKSFEQLSGRSRATSRNVTEIDSSSSTPTPAASPLPQDGARRSGSESESYSEDFSLAEENGGKGSVVLKEEEGKGEEGEGEKVDETFVVCEGGEGFKDETTVRVLEMENERLKKDVELMQVSFAVFVGFVEGYSGTSI